MLTVVLNLIVFVPYHYLQQHQFFPTTVMPMSVVDRLIPFVDWTVVIYLSVYLLMPIGPFLMNDRKQIFRYSAGVILMGVMADVAFLFWPTVCLRPAVESTNPIYQSLISIDTPFHAFPSLHAAFAVYSALCGILVFTEMNRHWMWQVGFWFWTLAILLATLTTRQHVLVDLVGGSILAVGAYFIVFRERTSFKDTKQNEPLPAQPNQLVNL